MRRIIPVAVVWVVLILFAWFAPNKEISQAERRPLQQMPEISADTVLNGGFMEKFQAYTLDQFPLRDGFRSIKSLFSYHALQQRDNNGIYMEDGYVAKLEYPLHSVSVSNALKKFNYIYTQYLQETGSRIYVTIVPDKGYYLSAVNGYPSMDYAKLFADVSSGMPWAQMVDITSALDITDYYRTDAHWRQEKLGAVAQTLCNAMGSAYHAEAFEPVLVSNRFYGVYYGQAAYPMSSEDLYIMAHDSLTDSRVYNHETGQYQPVYDREKLGGMDPYDVYLSGAQALLTIENPHAKTDKSLLVFRDSFGSSLVPLLVEDYATVTLVDIRYISSALLGEYLTFQDQDVLFLYSTLILNNSATLK